MPTVAAVTVTDDPTSLNSPPGVPVSTTLTITNVGNVAYDAAISPTLPSGWTISGEDTPVSLAVGASTTETVDYHPARRHAAQFDAGRDADLRTRRRTRHRLGPRRDAEPGHGRSGYPGGRFGRRAGRRDAGRAGLVSYTVTNSLGTVVFTSTPVPIALPEVIGVTSVDLGNLDTTGFSPGTYYDQCHRQRFQRQCPSPAPTGQGNLFVGAPITASQSLSADTLAAGQRHGYQHAFDRRPGTIGPGRHGQRRGKRGRPAATGLLDRRGGYHGRRREQSGQPDGGRHVRLGHAQQRAPRTSARWPATTWSWPRATPTARSTSWSIRWPIRPARRLLGNTTIDYQFPGSLFVARDHGLRDDLRLRLLRRRPEHDHRPVRRLPGHRLQQPGQPRALQLAGQYVGDARRRREQRQRRRGGLELLGLRGRLHLDRRRHANGKRTAPGRQYLQSGQPVGNGHAHDSGHDSGARRGRPGEPGLGRRHHGRMAEPVRQCAGQPDRQSHADAAGYHQSGRSGDPRQHVGQRRHGFARGDREHRWLGGQPVRDQQCGVQ